MELQIERKQPKDKFCGVRFTSEIYEKIEDHANRQNTTISNVVRAIVEAWAGQNN